LENGKKGFNKKNIVKFKIIYLEKFLLDEKQYLKKKQSFSNKIELETL